MKPVIGRTFLLFSVIGIVFGCLGSLYEAQAGAPVKLYYEENAQVELISPKGSRVLIDVHDPNALSSPRPRGMFC